jgi:hypothetical protein
LGFSNSTEYSVENDCEPWINVEQGLLNSYGFHNKAAGDVEEFLSEYIDAWKQEMRL